MRYSGDVRRAIHDFLFGTAATGSFLSELLVLAARVLAGLSLAVAHGWGKVPPSPKFILTVGGLGFPQPTLFAWMSGATELVGGLLLAAGLLTRPAAFAIAVNMGVAAFLAHARDPFRARELALLFLASALVFLSKGGGRFALDRVVGRRF